MQPAFRWWPAIAVLLLPGLLTAAESIVPAPAPAAVAPPAVAKPPKQSAVPPAGDVERMTRELRALFKTEYASRKADDRRLKGPQN